MQVEKTEVHFLKPISSQLPGGKAISMDRSICPEKIVRKNMHPGDKRPRA